MIPKIKITPIVLSLLIAAVLQIGFILVDKDDTPYRAVSEFAKAYFNADETMTDRMCEKSKTKDGVNVVNTYLYNKAEEAAERGFDPSYLHENIHHLKLEPAECKDCDEDTVKIRVTGYTTPGVKAFFTGEDAKKVDTIITVVKEKDVWKVCGNLFSLSDI